MRELKKFLPILFLVPLILILGAWYGVQSAFSVVTEDHTYED